MWLVFDKNVLVTIVHRLWVFIFEVLGDQNTLNLLDRLATMLFKLMTICISSNPMNLYN
jgi:hypothetical protein